jgi:radical SAM superfamily enzyme YgiQ (UPF0313 family)
MILPALTEAKSPFWRPIKYSLFPPLGLATLAAYLDESDQVTLQDEHVETLDLDDQPELVVIQLYITCAYRAYQLADHYRSRGAHVCLGGLHVTSLPLEAALHADTIFIGPGEDTWPAFLKDYRAGHPGKVYRSQERSLLGAPPVRRDLIKRRLYLVPNSIVVSRGCPYTCDFCYKESFFRGGKSFYTQAVDQALAEIERLPGRHLYFLDDHLFGNPRFAEALFDGMRGMRRLWQAASTVQSVLAPGLSGRTPGLSGLKPGLSGRTPDLSGRTPGLSGLKPGLSGRAPDLLEKAAASGLRSLFIGFETLSAENLRSQGKTHNLNRDYTAAVRRLHEHGVMVNASFVFGMDMDDESVFDRTVEWAIEQGVETATFHILTPYPGTALYGRLAAQGRIKIFDWDLYDTRHAVFHPARMSRTALEAGYWRAYRQFYRWGSIFRSASAHDSLGESLRHFAYAAGWKKFEPLWDWVIRLRRVSSCLPLLEAVLAGFGRRESETIDAPPVVDPIRIVSAQTEEERL